MFIAQMFVLRGIELTTYIVEGSATTSYSVAPSLCDTAFYAETRHFDPHFVIL